MKPFADVIAGLDENKVILYVQQGLRRGEDSVARAHETRLFHGLCMVDCASFDKLLAIAQRYEKALELAIQQRNELLVSHNRGFDMRPEMEELTAETTAIIDATEED